MPPTPPAASPPRLSSSRRLEEDSSQWLADRGTAGLAYLAALANHPTLAPLLAPGTSGSGGEPFDPAAFAAQVMRDSGGSAAVSKSRAEVVVGQLTEQLGKVEEAIERHILQHQQRLMQSMGDLGELKENCDVLTIRSKELRRSVKKLSNELLEPYQSMELRTHQLRRIHAANDLLKKVARFSATLMRLRKGPLQGLAASEMGGGEGDRAVVGALAGLDPRELAKAAAHLHELEGLVQDPSLSGITVIAADRAYVTSLGQSLRQAAQFSLHGALRSMNQAELGPALQVFYNLRVLPAVVLESLQLLVAEACEATARALNPQALERVAATAAAGEGPPSSSSSSQPASSAAAKAGGVSGGSGSGVLGEVEAIALRQRRARFREHGERWAAALGQCAVRVWHLQRVLHKQVDAVSNDRFLDVVLQSEAFQQALEKATATSSPPANDGSTSLSLSLSRGGKGGRASHTQPPSVGPLYWVFWLELTAAVRKIVTGAAGKGAAQQQQQQLVKSYPYFSLASAGVLQRLAMSTSKDKAGGAGGLLSSLLSTGVHAGGVSQGNPLAMRALMEALGGGGTEGGMQAPSLLPSGARGEGSASEGLLLGEVGASAEERDALLGAFASLRELYLSESLQRLCKPVEQMFPKLEGYQAAMPSKHDLQAFSKVAHAELLGGLAEGGPALLPHLARGVGEAVRLFCGKVEGMAKTGEGARRLNPLRGWVLSPEKQHNLQLLQLLAFLHQALRRMPKDLAAASVDYGGVGSGGALPGERELEGACAALEALAVGGFIQPYLTDIANELGGILAEMHLDSYAPKGEEAQAETATDETSSRFIGAFQAAVKGLKKHHLSRFPTQAEFAIRGLQWLAGRVLRTYVSHAALVRPLNERGKAKLSHDMAALETALSSIYPKVSELGPPYQELRAFRELCFFGDDRRHPLTAAGLLKEERLTAHLRPSTLLDALFARAPLEMSSPHVLQRCSERTLVEELLALYYGDKPLPTQQDGHEPEPDPRLGAETAHWQVVQTCLDAYAQRVSAAHAEPAYLYDVMLNLGPALLKGWGEKVAREGKGAEGGVRWLPLGW